MPRWLPWFSRKESAVGRLIARFSLGRAVFPNRDFANFAKEAYQLNVIAYRCIELISTSAASVPWLLYRDDKEITDHPLLTLLRRPNPMQSGKEFFTSVYAFELLTGNTYEERVRVAGGTKVQELWALRPDRVKILPGRTGLPAGFEYTVHGEKKTFDVDPVNGMSEVLHVKLFNPLNDWYGQSPLEAMGMSVDSHNEATRWNYALLKNAARPSGALEYEGELDEDNFNRLKTEMETSYGNHSTGRSGAGRPMLLQGGLKWVQMMLNPADMDWLEAKKVSAGEIAIGFNVPEQLVGVEGQQTYNNYREARMSLFEDAVLPLLDRHAEALTNWMQAVPGFEGLRVGYDPDRIPALALRREAAWDRVEKATFLTIDEKREALGYEPYKPGEQPGEVILVGAALIPYTDAAGFSLGAAPTAEGDVPPVEGEEGEEEGAPTPTDAGALGTVPADGTVQDLALNGAQIQALVAIVQAVVDGALPAESAIQIILVSFPTIDEQEAQALIQPAEEHEPPKPDPLPMMPGVPPKPGAAPGQPPKPAQPPKKPSTPVEKHVMRFAVKHAKLLEKRMLRKAHRLAYGK